MKKNDNAFCQSNIIHVDCVQTVGANMPKDELIYELADLYKVFGDSTRLKILSALGESELCVCDLAYLLSMTVSAVSHQLRLLKSAKLVQSRKSGKVVYYKLMDDHVRTIIGIGLEHICE